MSQTAVISGTSSGIGTATALHFAEAGFHVLALGRNQERLSELQKKFPEFITTLAFDLKDIESKKQMILEKLQKLPTPTVLINNAGIFARGGIEDTTEQTWFEQFNINLFSAVSLTKILWPFFKNKQAGSIVNVSSTLGVKPTADTQAYSAAKAALINWTLALAQEGSAHNIRANCICPGIVDTPIHSFHHLPTEKKSEITSNIEKIQLLRQIGEPEDIANAIYFLASEKSKWTTGSVLNVDGGINLK